MVRWTLQDTLAFLLLLSLLLPSLLIMFIPSTFKRPVSSWKALNLRKTLLMASSVRLKPLIMFSVNIQTACLIMEGAEFTENIINGVERPVKAAELFAFTLRVRAGNTDVLTDAEENVRQKLRAEGVM